jgi:hypothetical protein
MTYAYADLRGQFLIGHVSPLSLAATSSARQSSALTSRPLRRANVSPDWAELHRPRTEMPGQGNLAQPASTAVPFAS